MSRAFVKEDDSGTAPLIPPRAALPPNTPNYVTPNGLEELRLELQNLESQRSQAEQLRDNDAERTRKLTIVKAQIAALTQRINNAKVVEPKHEKPGEVRFGSIVCLQTVKGGRRGTTRKFKIVGVDEADVKLQKIAFVAPIAKAVIGHKLNDEVNLTFGQKTEMAKITSITYE
jgi:transcription elongation factor GreB